MEKGRSFSKFFSNIKLVCELELLDNGCPKNEFGAMSLWHSPGNYYAYFYTQGLRAITNEFYNTLKRFKIKEG